METNPAIVIVAFNRPDHLQRLLDYISVSKYPDTLKIPLVISIDYQKSEENNQVLQIAKSFQWPKGSKKIITHSENLGLRKHILKCGDLTEDFGSIILLEDDLVVAPAFYKFALKASKFYENNDDVAGISLYAYEYEELDLYRFYPKFTGKSTYLMQWASSWGQLWTVEQWKGFRTWYSENKNIDGINISNEVKNWKNSWKKFFLAYLVEKNKFFVYPYTSYTTLIDDIGTNIKNDAKVNQVLLSDEIDAEHLTFPKFNQEVKYDSFFQPINRSVYIPELDKEIPVCFDFYGTKSLKNMTSDYVFGIKESNATIREYSNALIPYENNVLNNEKGNVFVLSKRTDLIERHSLVRSGFVWSSFRRKNSVREMLIIILSKLIYKGTGRA